MGSLHDTKLRDIVLVKRSENESCSVCMSMGVVYMACYIFVISVHEALLMLPRSGGEPGDAWSIRLSFGHWLCRSAAERDSTALRDGQRRWSLTVRLT